jgi:hypothetical protein
MASQRNNVWVGYLKTSANLKKYSGWRRQHAHRSFPTFSNLSCSTASTCLLLSAAQTHVSYT